MNKEQSTDTPQTKDFPLADILSVTSARLLSPRGMSVVYDILSFLAGRTMSTMDLVFTRHEVLEPLGEQVPDLFSQEVNDSIKKLCTQLGNIPDQSKKMSVLSSWTENMELKYGKSRRLTALNLGE